MENERAIVVHFSSRREAEGALRRGSNVAGQNIKMDWYDDNYTLSSTNTQQTDGNYIGDSTGVGIGDDNNVEDNLPEYQDGIFFF